MRLFSFRLDPAITTSPQTEELFDLIASSQSRRLDDQRVNVGSLPGLRITHNNLGHLVGEGDHQEPSDDFFNMLIKCQVRPEFSYDSSSSLLILETYEREKISAATLPSPLYAKFMNVSDCSLLGLMISGVPRQKQASTLPQCLMKTSLV